jgi:hypothetical protein
MNVSDCNRGGAFISSWCIHAGLVARLQSIGANLAIERPTIDP